VRQRDDADRLRQPVSDLRDDRAYRVQPGKVGRQRVAGQHHVEVHQQEQPEHARHRVADEPGRRPRRPGRARPAADHPAGERDGDRADGEAGHRGGRGAAGGQARQRPTGTADRLQADQDGHRGEAPVALQHPAQRAEHGQWGERDGEGYGRAGAGTDEGGERRGGGQPEDEDARGEGEPEPERPGGGVWSPVLRRDRQRDAGLQPHRRHGADDQDRHQCAQLAEGVGHQQPGRDHGEQVA
jgi:hypothetical protein